MGITKRRKQPHLFRERAHVEPPNAAQAMLHGGNRGAQVTPDKSGERPSTLFGPGALPNESDARPSGPQGDRG